MLRRRFIARPAAGVPLAAGVVAVALLAFSPAPLPAQERDSAAARPVQVISPDAGRRRAEAAGTTIPGERPAGPLSFAPDSAPELSDLLTAREMERMGLAKLSAAEQAELAQLLVRWRGMGRMGAMAPRAWAVPLGRRFPARERVTRVEHVEQGDPRTATTVAEIAAGGTIVVLGDGTMWEVYLPDRVTTAAWRTGESVRVRPASVDVGDFDHELLYAGEADRVLVRFRGRSGAR